MCRGDVGVLLVTLVCACGVLLYCYSTSLRFHVFVFNAILDSFFWLVIANMGEGGIVNTLKCCFVTDAQRALIAVDVCRLPVTVVDTLIHVTHTVDTVPGTWQEIKLNLPDFTFFGKKVKKKCMFYHRVWLTVYRYLLRVNSLLHQHAFQDLLWFTDRQCFVHGLTRPAVVDWHRITCDEFATNFTNAWFNSINYPLPYQCQRCKYYTHHYYIHLSRRRCTQQCTAISCLSSNPDTVPNSNERNPAQPQRPGQKQNNQSSQRVQFCSRGSWW